MFFVGLTPLLLALFSLGRIGMFFTTGSIMITLCGNWSNNGDIVCEGPRKSPYLIYMNQTNQHIKRVLEYVSRPPSTFFSKNNSWIQQYIVTHSRPTARRTLEPFKNQHVPPRLSCRALHHRARGWYMAYHYLGTWRSRSGTSPESPLSRCRSGPRVGCRRWTFHDRWPRRRWGSCREPGSMSMLSAAAPKLASAAVPTRWKLSLSGLRP